MTGPKEETILIQFPSPADSINKKWNSAGDIERKLDESLLVDD